MYLINQKNFIDLCDSLQPTLHNQHGHNIKGTSFSFLLVCIFELPDMVMVIIPKISMV